MLARKNQLSNLQSGTSITLQRSRLMQAKTLAIRRQDYAEVTEIEAKLAELPAIPTPARNAVEESLSDKLAKVNERNRKANLEAVRKAELMEAERKRRERKLNASGTATPADPSARLKTVPRLFNDTTSRFVLVLLWLMSLGHLSCLDCIILRFSGHQQLQIRMEHQTDQERRI